MKITIDTNAATLVVSGEGGADRSMPLYSREAFHELSRVWVTTGWELKYPYGFSWMGRPVIQLPEDMITVQEVIYRVKPDVIVETGIAHGGSLIFSASLCKAMGRGRVIGVDIDIRAHNRAAIEAHELFGLIDLIEGSSVEPAIAQQVRDLIGPRETVLVILDSDHSKAHVTAELEAYAPMVTPGSYVVATDGVMAWLTDVPRGSPGWDVDNPTRAAEEWLVHHPEFVLEDPPPFVFNEGLIDERVTHWPGAYLRRTGSSS
jgi:cephalosporin hydroxylase